MADFVEWDGKLIPRSLAEGVQVPGACVTCGGLGSLFERIDRDRWPTKIPCWHCRRYCPTCAKWVKREGHEHF